MSCCDDDSSPDHYQPIKLHHSKGVADDKTVAIKTKSKFIPPLAGGVTETRSVQFANDCPPLSDTGIILNDDDPELDRIFASVEVNFVLYYKLITSNR